MTSLTILFKKHGIVRSLMILEIISEVLALTVPREIYVLAVALSVPKLYYVTLKKCPRISLFFLTPKKKGWNHYARKNEKRSYQQNENVKTSPQYHKGIL